MRRLKWMLAFSLIGAFCAPVMADDPNDVEDGMSEDAVVEVIEETPAEVPEEKSPIRRLVEMKLDEFVVPARQVNLGLPGRVKTVQDILDKFKEYQDDEKVGAVLLNITNFGLATPLVEELRDGVQRLRDSGKTVYAYVQGGGPAEYQLACAADEIAMAPVGSIFIPGIARLFPFTKGNMEMRGLEAQVVTAGRYKNPGFEARREADEFFKEEITSIIDSWYDSYKQFIVDGRGLSTSDVEKLIDTAIFRADEARNVGLIDTLAYYDDYRDRILKRERIKPSHDSEEGFGEVMSLQDIMETINEEMRKQRERYEDVGPKIAVLHARGPIIDYSLGAMFSTSIISRDDFIKVIDQIRRNKSIKAVVLAVDSPGGSGYASEMILRALKELDEKKPLVVCMQTVAGSGGYYISIPGRLIFAQPTTITGSIGVLATNVSPAGMYNRMDYDFLDISRGKHSMMFFGINAWNDEEKELIKDHLHWFYNVFTDRVAEGRHLPKQRVLEIAEGRIYTGKQAIDIGLVDRLGGLDDAIEAARDFANIPPSADLKIIHYPRPTSIGDLFESFASMGSPTVMMQAIDAPAPELNFEQQLMLLSQPRFGGKVLTWMPLPDIRSMLTPAPGFPVFPGGFGPQGATAMPNPFSMQN